MAAPVGVEPCVAACGNDHYNSSHSDDKELLMTVVVPSPLSSALLKPSVVDK